LLYLIILTDFDFIFIQIKGIVKHSRRFIDAQISLKNLFIYGVSDLHHAFMLSAGANIKANSACE